jgi:hypothetical protein
MSLGDTPDFALITFQKSDLEKKGNGLGDGVVGRTSGIEIHQPQGLAELAIGLVQRIHFKALSAGSAQVEEGFVGKIGAGVMMRQHLHDFLDPISTPSLDLVRDLEMEFRARCRE